MHLVLLDTETTGFKDARIVELAYHVGENAFGPFRFKPGIPIEESATKVHGITNEMVADREILQEWSVFKETKDIFESGICVAHNADFDRAVLAREGIFPEQWICTKRVSQKLFAFRKSHKLQDIRADFFPHVTGDAHSAAGDVAVLRALLEYEMKELSLQGYCGDTSIEQMLEWSRKKSA